MISAILLRREGVGQAAQTIWLDSRNGMPIRKRDLRRRSIELARAEADSSSGAADGSEPLKQRRSTALCSWSAVPIRSSVGVSVTELSEKVTPPTSPKMHSSDVL